VTSSAITRALMVPALPPRVIVVEQPARPSPCIPRIAIVFPIEARVDVEVECRDSERERLFFDVLADHRKVELIERAFELAEDVES
jgi:hypothetical protein